MFGGVLLVAALWLRWWLLPERQIPRAQARLLSAVARRDFDALAALLAADYGDRWGQDRAVVVMRSREIFGQFGTLRFERESQGLRSKHGNWFLSEKIRLNGFGGPFAMAAREKVNAFREPFVMEWHRRSGAPWDWELKSVAQSELELVE